MPFRRGAAAGIIACGVFLQGPAAAQSTPVVYVPFVDYPANAAKDGAAHQVGAALRVDADGSVVDCQVLRSSGISGLDAATCLLLLERGRFIPPQSSKSQYVEVQWGGKPIEPSSVKPGAPLLVWSPGMIANDDYPPDARGRGEEGIVMYEAEVGDSGRALVCRIRSSSNSKALDKRTCELVLERGRFLPATRRDGDGNVYLGRMEWRL